MSTYIADIEVLIWQDDPRTTVSWSVQGATIMKVNHRPTSWSTSSGVDLWDVAWVLV